MGYYNINRQPDPPAVTEAVKKKPQTEATNNYRKEAEEIYAENAVEG